MHTLLNILIQKLVQGHSKAVQKHSKEVQKHSKALSKNFQIVVQRGQKLHQRHSKDCPSGRQASALTTRLLLLLIQTMKEIKKKFTRPV